MTRSPEVEEDELSFSDEMWWQAVLDSEQLLEEHAEPRSSVFPTTCPTAPPTTGLSLSPRRNYSTSTTISTPLLSDAQQSATTKARPELVQIINESNLPIIEHVFDPKTKLFVQSYMTPAETPSGSDSTIYLATRAAPVLGAPSLSHLIARSSQASSPSSSPTTTSGSESDSGSSSPNVPARTRRSISASKRAWLPSLPSISVTDVSESQWCEIQWVFKRVIGRSSKILQALGCVRDTRKDAILSRGKAIHHELELEVHDLVKVKAKTWEDRVALKILKTIFGLYELVQKGITREIYMHSIVRHSATNTSILLTGIIDQISRREMNENSTDFEYVIADHKTRNSSTLPGQAQTVTTRAQLALYRAMFLQAITSPLYPSTEELARAMGTHGDQILNDEVQEYARDVYRTLKAFLPPTKHEDSLRITLLDIFTWRASMLSLFVGAKLSNSVEVHYVHSRTKSHLGVITFDATAPFDPEQMSRPDLRENQAPSIDNSTSNYLLQSFLDIALGERASVGVSIEEAPLKCAYCEYGPICAFRQSKSIEFLQANMAKRPAFSPKHT